MKLTDAQFCLLNRLAEYGPAKDAVEIAGPRGMDGKRKIKLQWDGTSKAALDKIEAAGWVAITRERLPTPVNAVGGKGNPRTGLTISITDAGRTVLANA
jgi:hypothetical protein